MKGIVVYLRGIRINKMLNLSTMIYVYKIRLNKIYLINIYTIKQKIYFIIIIKIQLKMNEEDSANK